MFRCHVSMLLLWTLAELTAADPVCDPVTQYLNNGECCQKCKPGTSMVSMGVCRSPVCKDCDENEYMDRYNTEQMCKRQPSCDLNSNFKWPESTSTTQRHQCQCKEGFHCSSVSCLTCVPHTECELGYGAFIIGGQTQDTMCEKCPDGTFSDEKSWNGTCKERTHCLFGIVPKGHKNECGHLHVGLIILAVIIAILAVVVAIVLLVKCKGKTAHVPLMKPVNTADPELGPNINGKLDEMDTEEEETARPFLANPTDAEKPPGSPCQESTYPSGCPEETEDVVFTANGNVLSQDAKEYVLSQPETQAIAVK